MAVTSISPVEIASQPHELSTDEIAERTEQALQQGIILARLAFPPRKIWAVEIDEGGGMALFFFVGTYQQVARKLRELPDDWSRL